MATTVAERQGAVRAALLQREFDQRELRVGDASEDDRRVARGPETGHGGREVVCKPTRLEPLAVRAVRAQLRGGAAEQTHEAAETPEGDEARPDEGAGIPARGHDPEVHTRGVLDVPVHQLRHVGFVAVVEVVLPDPPAQKLQVVVAFPETSEAVLTHDAELVPFLADHALPARPVLPVARLAQE